MTPQEFESVLRQTIDDGRLSRAERKDVAARLAAAAPDAAARADFRRTAFALARARVADPAAAPDVMEWLEEVTKVLLAPAGDGRAGGASGGVAESHFSPGEACVRRIVALLGASRRSADVCVFTITDDRIAGAIEAAHRRGVAVRVVTDNEKAFDPGSDVVPLARAGVPVRVDRSPFHMHHKFALFDAALLLTGSYNWTRSAATNNEENLIVSDDRRLVADFARAFERLWADVTTPV